MSNVQAVKTQKVILGDKVSFTSYYKDSNGHAELTKAGETADTRILISHEAKSGVIVGVRSIGIQRKLSEVSSAIDDEPLLYCESIREKVYLVAADMRICGRFVMFRWTRFS